MPDRNVTDIVTDMTWDNPVMYLKYDRDLARKGDYKRALMFMDEVSSFSRVLRNSV